MRERARELIAEARRNGVEHELRDGRDFIVLRLPSVELRPAERVGSRARVRRHVEPLS